jgi:hypothetical protein
MTTFCAHCEHKGQDNKSDAWWRWYCRKAPYEAGEQFVTDEPWLNGPPFKLCRWVNKDGVCPDWAEKRESDASDNQDQIREPAPRGQEDGQHQG